MAYDFLIKKAPMSPTLPEEVIDQILQFNPSVFFLVNKLYCEKTLKHMYNDIRFKPWRHGNIFKRKTRSQVFLYHKYVEHFHIDVNDLLYNSSHFWSNLGMLKNCKSVDIDNQFEINEPNVIFKLRQTLPWITGLTLSSFRNNAQLFESLKNWDTLVKLEIDVLLPSNSADLFSTLPNLEDLVIDSAANDTFIICGEIVTIKRLSIKTWISEGVRHIFNSFPNLESLKFLHFPFLQGNFIIDTLPKSLVNLEMSFLDYVDYTFDRLAFKHLRNCDVTLEYVNYATLLNLFQIISQSQSYALSIIGKVIVTNRMCTNYYRNEEIYAKCHGKEATVIILDQFHEAAEISQFIYISRLVDVIGGNDLKAEFMSKAMSPAFKFHHIFESANSIGHSTEYSSDSE